MKNFGLIVALLLFILPFGAFRSTENVAKAEKNVLAPAKIEIYYFHYSRRCITCNAVESVTKDALESYFGADVKAGKIVFLSVNLDETENEQLAERLKVSGQTLLFVAGAKQVNLTNEGFMYAKSKPDKLKEKVKTTVEELRD